MISGEVTAQREAVFRLLVRGVGGIEVEVDAVLDTGFDDYLTLPWELVAELALPRLDSIPVMLADGSIVRVEVHEARIVWDGEVRTIPVQATHGGILFGMSLLYGCFVSLEVIDGGAAAIESMESL